MPNNSNSVYYIKPKPGAKPNSSSAVSAAPPEKTHKLVLTTTSLRNVVIANATDVLYYEVVTPRWERHLTRVSRLDPNTRCFDPVAELVNGNGREHRNVNGVSGGVEGVREEQDAKRVLALRFYGMGELMPVEEFLHTEQGRSKKEHPDGL
ncbi:hypothetical protein BD414DRAFT_477023 [Trametes punicea]|nr:hypothetical protein BD414DRAFT_477023 [Trametes punicea]